MVTSTSQVDQDLKAVTEVLDQNNRVTLVGPVTLVEVEEVRPLLEVMVLDKMALLTDLAEAVRVELQQPAEPELLAS